MSNTGVQSTFGGTVEGVHIESGRLGISRFTIAYQHDDNDENIYHLGQLRTSSFAKKVPEGWSIFGICRKAASQSDDGDRVRIFYARVASLGGQKVRHDGSRPGERLRKDLETGLL